MQIQRSYKTVEEWELSRGRTSAGHSDSEQLRSATTGGARERVRGALSNLERGKGSSLSTVVAVIRALGRTRLAEVLAPPVSVSPLQMLRAQRRSRRCGCERRRRVSTGRESFDGVPAR